MCYLCRVSSRSLEVRRILGCLWAKQERELLSITEVCHGERLGIGGPHHVFSISGLKQYRIMRTKEIFELRVLWPCSAEDK